MGARFISVCTDILTQHVEIQIIYFDKYTTFIYRALTETQLKVKVLISEQLASSKGITKIINVFKQVFRNLPLVEQTISPAPKLTRCYVDWSRRSKQIRQTFTLFGAVNQTFGATINGLLNNT